MNITLWQINSEILNILMKIDELEKNGEAVPEELQLQKTEKMNELVLKADKCALFNNFLEKQSEFIKQEIEHLKSEKERFEKMQDNFHKYLLPIIEIQGGVLKGETHRIKVSSRESVNIVNEMLIPPEYFSVVSITKLDKKLLGEHLKAGLVLESANLVRNKFLMFK